jgi:hypothetical protein
MKLAELQKYIGQKIPGTHLTPLEDLGTKISYGKYRRFFKLRCDCDLTVEFQPTHIYKKNKTCGHKECPYYKILRQESHKIRRKKSILLKNKEYNFFLVKSVYQAYVDNANTRKLEWRLMPQDIEELWIEQGGKCKITGVQLTCGTNKRNHTWSLDRIDGSKPYTKDNIQIVSKTYNMVKHTRTDEEMRLIAYLITQNTAYEQLRAYNSMTLEQINSMLKQTTKTKRK